MEPAIFVGIDWASDHHDVAIVTETGATLALFRVEQSVAGFADLLVQIDRTASSERKAIVALERPDGLLVAALLDKGYPIYPINPKAVDRYRGTRRSGSGIGRVGRRMISATHSSWHTSSRRIGTCIGR